MTDIVTRAESGLRAPTGSLNRLAAKVLGVVVHYEGPKMGDFDHSLCRGKVLGIQRFHQVVRGWSDVAYNYIVCPHGEIFECRGLDYGSAANGTTKANQDYYAVCALIGAGDQVTPSLIDGIKRAIALCRTRAGNAVLGHRDVIATACPGDALYGLLNEFRTVPARVVKTVSRTVRRAVQKVTRAPLMVDGVLGPQTIRQWQKVMGTYQDGVISKPSLLIRAVQLRLAARPVDGYLGPITWKAVQRRLGVKADGIPGPITIKALQRRLNTNQF